MENQKVGFIESNEELLLGKKTTYIKGLVQLCLYKPFAIVALIIDILSEMSYYRLVIWSILPFIVMH
ncbi:hypothetical protein SF1_03550 [Sphingobacterium faecium NBRC 15299]|nr:hypothetical protein SF1_03550 [Sphingobacterium faecium NBRC 15299]